MVVPDVSFTAGFCPFVMFSFTSCIPTPWTFACAGFSAVSQSGQYQGIQCWGFLRFISSKRAARVSPPELLGGLVFVCLSGSFVGIFLSLVPCLYRGISVFSKNLNAPVSSEQ